MSGHTVILTMLKGKLKSDPVYCTLGPSVSVMFTHRNRTIPFLSDPEDPPKVADCGIYRLFFKHSGHTAKLGDLEFEEFELSEIRKVG